MIRVRLFLILCTLVTVGGLLRFSNIVSNPVSLNIDEVSIGYNAYSILQTGKDEYGQSFPLSFKSVGDYKPPVLIYLMVPSIAIFGLNEWGVRFPGALISTLSIIIFYLFFKKIVKEEKIILLSTALLAISPWHIYFSRYAVESSIAISLVVAGIFFFLKMMEGGWFWSLSSSFFLVLSMYAYHTERLFVPLFLSIFFAFNLRKLLARKTEVIIFLMTSLLLAIPLISAMFFGPDKTRVQMTFIINDIEFIRNIVVDKVQSSEGSSATLLSVFSENNFLLFFYWARKYLNYFHPSFLFYNGLNMTIPGTYGLGVMYLFEAVWLLVGVTTFIFNKNLPRFLVGAWVLVGIFPASLTINEQHSLRTLVILPMTILVSGTGGIMFLNLVSRLGIYKKFIILSLFGIFAVWNLMYAFLIFSVHFPKQQGEAFMEGTKEAVSYAMENQTSYKEIVFDPVRGIYGPYTVSIPHMYVLFYSQYDPKIYQSELKRSGEDSYGFNKYTIRKIDWLTDRDKKDVLFIGSPWSLPEKDLKDSEILKRIYLSNGRLVFLIVSPE